MEKNHYARWAFLLDTPFTISDKCCDIMKEAPIYAYERRTGKRSMVGAMAVEGTQRKQAWSKTGCNNFDSERPLSKPLSFWTNQDILRYIKDIGIPIASVYGNIVEDNKGRLFTTGEQRTGCVFCPVGCNREKVNRFQRLAVSHPKLHEYCMNTLGLGEFLDYLGIARE
jgi:3'-phosphoadenosine 5'-phosphosulfate sulfotransferase (PAPS reductase)/FAD synthetase